MKNFFNDFFLENESADLYFFIEQKFSCFGQGISWNFFRAFSWIFMYVIEPP